MSQEHPDRRREITEALRACALEKGYPATTLADVAPGPLGRGAEALVKQL